MGRKERPMSRPLTRFHVTRPIWWRLAQFSAQIIEMGRSLQFRAQIMAQRNQFFFNSLINY